MPPPVGAPAQLPSYPAAPGAPGIAPALTAEASTGSILIREGGRVVSSFRTAAPYVEQTRWMDNQEQIVVKSRGSHGPATVQLFQSRTGRELGRVMAYDVRGGQPAWAASMAE